jgi:hypothetical protein
MKKWKEGIRSDDPLTWTADLGKGKKPMIGSKPRQWSSQKKTLASQKKRGVKRF